MIHFSFTEQDKRYLFLKCDGPQDYPIYKRLKEHINLVDPICYLPTYSGPPFTEDFIWEYTQPTGSVIMYSSIGMWQVVYKYLKANNIPYDGLIENQQMFRRKLPHTFDEFKDIVDSWGLKFPPRPYQYESAYNILTWYRSLSQLATRAGKTLISYIIFRYAMTYLDVKNILMIVPSVDLVKQAKSDFEEYAEFFKTECVWSGGKKLCETPNLTVGTFQSLIKFLDKKSDKYNPAFFNKFDCVFVDEVHRAKARQIRTIISQPFMSNVKLLFGMTGTLPAEHTIEHYCLHSLIGAKIQEISPRELMDDGYISEVQINQIRLNYDDIIKQQKLYIKCAEYALGTYVEVQDEKNPKKTKKVKLEHPEFLIQYAKRLPDGILLAKEMVYRNADLSEQEKDELYIKNVLKPNISASTGTNALVIEKMMMHFMSERIDFLCEDILPQCKYNTLVLAHHTEYISYVVDEVTRRMPDKIVCCITGATKAKDRDAIKETLKANNNCVLIASYGCVGTGITLSNLCYGVLFESFKSEILNMQSIGRGLGLSKLKDKYILFDFIDCFDKSCSNKSIFRQGKLKEKLYEEQHYEYKIINKHI